MIMVYFYILISNCYEFDPTNRGMTIIGLFSYYIIITGEPISQVCCCSSGKKLAT